MHRFSTQSRRGAASCRSRFLHRWREMPRSLAFPGSGAREREREDGVAVELQVVPERGAERDRGDQGRARTVRSEFSQEGGKAGSFLGGLCSTRRSSPKKSGIADE